MSKGQVAAEYLILGSFLLLFVGAFAGYSLALYSDSVKNNAVNNAVVSLQDASGKVYSLGKGNVVIVEINLPDDVVGSGVAGTDFYFSRNFAGHESFAYGTAITGLAGSLPSAPGIYKIAVKALDVNVSFAVVG